MAAAVRSCVYFAERTAFRCPGSERSRGRWKFLWIKHGAEARWAVWVGSAPSPSRSSPALPPSSPGHPFMPPSWAPSSPPSSGASLTPAGPEQGSLGPLPEPGRGCRVTEGSPGRPAPPGPFSSWGPPLTTRSSSMRWELVCRPGNQHTGHAYGSGTQKMPSTQALSRVLLSGRQKPPGKHEGQGLIPRYLRRSSASRQDLDLSERTGGYAGLQKRSLGDEEQSSWIPGEPGPKQRAQLCTLQMPCGATVPGLSEHPGWPWVREEPGDGSRQVKGWADLRAL